MITKYHSLVGRQGRTGAGAGGLRYDAPVSSFVSRPMMQPVEDDAEPVAEGMSKPMPTPLDVVKELMSGRADSPMGLGSPIGADPVSSGDPTSDPAFGATEEGDRAVSQPQAAMEAFANEMMDTTATKAKTGFAMNLMGIPAKIASIPATPIAALATVAKPAYKAYKAYQQYAPPPDWKKTMAGDFPGEEPGLNYSGLSTEDPSKQMSMDPEQMGMPMSKDVDPLGMQTLGDPVGGTGPAPGFGGQSGSSHGFGDNPGSTGGDSPGSASSGDADSDGDGPGW